MLDLSSIAGPGIAGLLFLAIVNTMPETLPPPFCNWAPAAWLYRWCHDALKTFTSMRGPK